MPWKQTAWPAGHVSLKRDLQCRRVYVGGGAQARPAASLYGNSGSLPRPGRECGPGCGTSPIRRRLCPSNSARPPRPERAGAPHSGRRLGGRAAPEPRATRWRCGAAAAAAGGACGAWAEVPAAGVKAPVLRVMRRLQVRWAPRYPAGARQLLRQVKGILTLWLLRPSSRRSLFNLEEHQES